MKKIFTLAALAAASLALNAQDTNVYNYFNLADVDADGWLWFDSAEKLNKYCSFNIGEKKICYQDAQYELEDFSTPACEPDATATGYNRSGVKGGEGSKTGAIILPESKGELCGFSTAQFGGGIILQLPDVAQLDVYVSSEQQDLFMTLRAGKKNNLRYADLKHIYCMEAGNWFFDPEPLPDAPYCGAWANIQEYKYDYADELGGPIEIKCEKATGDEENYGRTIYIANHAKVPMYLHGIRVLTYSNTNNESAGVTDIAFDGEDEEAPMYNLQGVQVDESYKGFVIKNGKKYINR